MICRIEDLKVSCSVILSAISSNKITTTDDLLEIVVVNNNLYFNIANNESYISVKVCDRANEEFHATVNATKFLALISKFTTDTIELVCNDKMLIIKANGTYKIPVVYVEDHVVVLNSIVLNNIVNTFSVDSACLTSILRYNSKQMNIGVAANLVQKMYYVDGEGAITFTTGACINKFNLPITAKYLFNDRLVKLFKLLAGKQVNVKVAYDAISTELFQTKILFETDTISISYILSCDDSLVSTVPANAIRSMANDTFSHVTVVSRVEMLDAINRLSIFGDDSDLLINAEFRYTADSITFSFKSNEEVVLYKNGNNSTTEEYTAPISLKDLSQVLAAVSGEFVTLKFGNEKCFVVSSADVEYIIPESRIN